MRFQSIFILLALGVMSIIGLNGCAGTSDGGDVGGEDDLAIADDLPGDLGEEPADGIFPDEAEEDEGGEPDDPCDPNPCNVAPASGCDEDGVTQLVYVTPGTCTVEEGAAACDFDIEPFDCSDDDMVCSGGECVEYVDPCEPNPCTVPPGAGGCQEDGITLVAYVLPGTCEIVEGEAKCSFAENSTDCSEDDMVCLAGQCVDLCDPNPCLDTPLPQCDEAGEIAYNYAEEGVCSIIGMETECDYQETETNCADDDMVCIEGACYPDGAGNKPLEPGQIIFTEFMARSQSGSDKGEWIEVYNAGEENFDLKGCILMDQGSDMHEIGELLIAAPGDYLVLARSGDPVDNHGLEPDYVYGGTSLGNSDDELVLLCGEVEIDVVIYDATVVELGVSAQLDSLALDGESNDLLPHWCLATKEYGTAAKLGTPGTGNDECPPYDPCDPNPCTEPPAPTCAVNGLTALTYEPLGACTADGFEAVCDYTLVEIACDVDEKICEEGACVEPPPDPCDPNPCVEPPLAVCDGDVAKGYTLPGNCTPNEGQAECDYLPEDSNCADLSLICLDGFCVPEGTGDMPTEAGQIIFTEFMARSQSGADNGEWVEIFNTSAVPLDLNGCLLGDGGETYHTIGLSLVIPASGYLALAKSDVPEENHGVQPAYVYNKFDLNNSGDAMILTCADLEIDAVTYVSEQVTLGTAAQLKLEAYDHQANDLAENWCKAVSEYGPAGKFGTPGEANEACPVPDPCEENPCTVAPDPQCDVAGLLLTVFSAPGNCANVDGEAVCTYPSVDTNCADDNKICLDGQCVAGPCDPNPCLDPPDSECNGDIALNYLSPGTCTVVDNAAACEYTAEETNCADDSKLCVAGVCLPQGAGNMPDGAGQLIFTEFMARSQGGADSGEWMELHNPTDVAYDIGGCLLKDGGETFHEITGAVVVGPGEYLVLAKSEDPVANHGLAFDYVYDSFNLSNDGDSMILQCEGLDIDIVEYESGLVNLGIAAQLKLDSYDAVANDDNANWCLATEMYGTVGKIGTPGLENTACPIANPCEPNPCLEVPDNSCKEDGITLVYYQTPGNCEVIAEAPVCTYPEFETNCDDDGKVCKMGMCASSDPCDPNPCIEPPGPTCDPDGVTVIAYETPGSCSVDQDAPVCDYTEVLNNCADKGMTCDNGICVGGGGNQPEAEGDFIITEIMPRSKSNTDNGEWFELFNTTAEPLDLGGCFIKGNGTESHEIQGSLEVGGGMFVVMAKSGVPADNHGLPADYVYGTSIALSNSGSDTISIVCNETPIDTVVFTTSWVTLATAIQLAPDVVDATANDDFANWCLATEIYGTADKKGTPGGKNSPCL